MVHAESNIAWQGPLHLAATPHGFAHDDLVSAATHGCLKALSAELSPSSTFYVTLTSTFQVLYMILSPSVI